MFMMNKNLHHKTTKLRSIRIKCLIFFIVCVFLGTICPVAKADTIIIQDELSGIKFFSGFQFLNPDGSTDILGLTYIGDVIDGNLPGRWAAIMRAQYPHDVDEGDVLGFFAVGDLEQAAVYGRVTGKIDPIAGTFSFGLAIVGGIGLLEGFTGVGLFTGTLTNAGEDIDGSLSLVLNNEETGRPRRKLHKGDRENPALLLLELVSKPIN
jgi:hypothetical protein